MDDIAMEQNSLTPLVSIVTASLNQGRFIETALMSVRNQDYPSIEHVVIDGESTDNTLAILKRYSDKIRWISEPDKGQSDAINKGFGLARGEILAWLNADDYYVQGAIQTVADFMLRNRQYAMVYGDIQTVDQGGHLLKTYKRPDFDLKRLQRAGGTYIDSTATFFWRYVLDEVGFLDVSLHQCMDYDLYLRVGQRFDIGHIPRVLACLRVHSDSKTTKNPWRLHRREALMVRQRWHQANLLDRLFYLYYDARAELHHSKSSAKRILQAHRALRL